MKLLSQSLITALSFSFASLSYANNDCPYTLSQLKQDPYLDIRAFANVDDCSNFALFSERAYKNKINALLATQYPQLTLDDFDMGESIDNTNFNSVGVFTTHYWQKNKNYKNQELKIFISYDTQNDQALIVLLSVNEDIPANILGHNKYILLDPIVQHDSFNRTLLIDDKRFANAYKIAYQRSRR